MTFTVYIIKNKINGKLYVGQTSAKLKKRLQHHKNEGKTKNTYFHKAINKYGWDNFDVIKTLMCPDYLSDDFEKQLIKSFREDLGRENVYNIADGGLRKFHSKETKEKMSLLAKQQDRKPSKKAMECAIMAMSRPVIAYNKKDNEFVGWYQSIKQARKDLEAHNICRTLRGTTKSSNGYKFVYADNGGVLSL